MSRKNKKGDKDTPKVTRSNKLDLSGRAKELILKHPEITQNARSLFRNENGKTIVEEIVNRGDIKTKELISPRNQGDLKDDDLRGLAVHASTLIDKTISKYDAKMAKEDALMMSIRTKDGGKYDGKVNANTFGLILGYMDGIKKTAAQLSMEDTPPAHDYEDDLPDTSREEEISGEPEDETTTHQVGKGPTQVKEYTPGQEETIQKSLEEGSPEIRGGKRHVSTPELEKIVKHEGTPPDDEGTLPGDIDDNLVKPSQPEVPEGLDNEPIEAPDTVPSGESDEPEDTDESEYTDIDTEPEDTDTETTEEETSMNTEDLKKEAARLQEKIDAINVLLGNSKEAGEAPKCKKCGKPFIGKKGKTCECKKEKGKDASIEEDSITSGLDSIAGELEASGDPELFKIAFQLDQISDILEGKKEASALISDPDEKFMKEHFKAGIREGDSDEKKYMNHYNTDLSKEVDSVKSMKNGKDSDGTAKQASARLPYQKIKA